MYLSFHPSLIRGTTGDLRRRVELARAAGYQALDWTYREAEQIIAGPGESTAFWQAAGLRSGMVSGVFSARLLAPDAEFEAALAATPARARQVAAAGGTMTGVVLPNRSALPEAEARAMVRRRLRHLAEAVTAAGLRLGVEFIGVRTLHPELPHPLLPQYTQVLELLEDVGVEDVGLIVDSYHCHASGTPWSQIASTPASRIVHLHINDCKDIPLAEIDDRQRLLPGEGVIALADWFAALAATGFTGGVSPEILGPRLDGVPPSEAAETCRRGILAAMRAGGADVTVQ